MLEGWGGAAGGGRYVYFSLLLLSQGGRYGRRVCLERDGDSFGGSELRADADGLCAFFVFNLGMASMTV